jgi:signal peptidase I
VTSGPSANDARRSPLGRFGLLVLNVPLPGGGLIRAGRLRAGLALLCAYPALLIVMVIAARVSPALTPIGYLIGTMVLISLGLAIWIGMLFATWRASRFVARPLDWWRRWPALVVLALLAQVPTMLAVDLFRAQYRNFSIPSEAMAPTLEPGDRLVADMRDPRRFGRGDVIVFAMGEEMYVKRVAALPGDRIAMSGGIPVINGVPARQTRVPGRYGDDGLTRSVETFPGVRRSHQVLDEGRTMIDDVPEVVMPAGHAYVLGDNRDRSADSRSPRSAFGVEMLPMEDIRGRALFKTWGEGFRWLGTPIE